jgi:hypothetical protein
MLTATRERLSNYRLNAGNTAIVWNVVMLALLSFFIWNTRDPMAQLAMGLTVLVAASFGYVIIPVARWRFPLAFKSMTTARWVAIGILIVNLLNLYPMPPAAMLAALALLIWSLSASFFLITEPGVLTPRGQEELIRRYGAPDQAPDFEAPNPGHPDSSDRPDHPDRPSPAEYTPARTR